LAIGNFVKHYNTASSSITIQEIFKKGGHKAYAIYWLLIELLSQKFDGECVKIELHEQELVKHLRVRSDCLVKELQKSCNSSLSLLERVESLFVFEAPILLDLLHRDYKRARTERVQSAPKNKELRKKKEEVFDEEKFEIPNKIMQVLKIQHMYPESIITEVSRDAWLIFLGTDPATRKWDRFLTHYFVKEKEKILQKAIELSSQSIVDMSYSDLTKKLFSEAENV